MSVPNQFAEIDRPKKCEVEYLDYNGNKKILKAEGLLATCIQHEMDHLNGITFLDRLNPVKRKLVLRNYLADLEASQRSDELDRIAELHGGDDE